MNQMLRLYSRIWQIGGSMPGLLMQDREGVEYHVENPDPIYTFINYIEFLEREYINATNFRDRSIGEYIFRK